jgi:hypothetical protein
MGPPLTGTCEYVMARPPRTTLVATCHLLRQCKAQGVWEVVGGVRPILSELEAHVARL